jgi:Predicted integral membrane protein (DUF2269)
VLGITTYLVFKFLHVLLAIIAIGFNASYAILLSRAAKEPQHEGHVLRTVKILDDRFANPAYVLLLLTGLTMVWVGDVDLTQFWLATARIRGGGPGVGRVQARVDSRNRGRGDPGDRCDRHRLSHGHEAGSVTPSG